MTLRPETVDRINAMWHRPALRPNTISVVTIGSDTFLAAPTFLHERVARLDPVLDAGGFIAQWQSRVDNDASARVADKLGFVPLGGRVVVRVRRPSDGSRTMGG